MNRLLSTNHLLPDRSLREHYVGSRSEPRHLLTVRSLAVAILLLCNAVSHAESVQPAVVATKDGNRLTYLDERNPFYPHADFPKLTTPMWIGEPGVEAVILLSIDDMGRPAAQSQADSGPEAFLSFLCPLVNRLRQIDGRAPIAVMTCRTQPANPTLQKMLELGMSLDCHSYTHRFPFMRFDDKSLAGKDTLRECRDDFVACLENLFQVPNNRPVAYRMPGCDAQNTNSPRFYSEIFPLRTTTGQFLSCDTSIMTWFPADDKSLPPKLRFDDLERKRFEKYVFNIPQTKHFINHIRGYPYPYVINNLIWELPVTIPCDSHGVHQHRARSDKTVDDWKRAVDICVRKKGLCTLLFHTIGYINAEQLAAVIGYADRTYAGRVKFLNCREIRDRLVMNALGGASLRSQAGGDNGVRALDVNADGFLDFVIANGRRQETRVWDPRRNAWRSLGFPAPIVRHEDTEQPVPLGLRFWTTSTGTAGIAIADGDLRGVWEFADDGWERSKISLPETAGGIRLAISQQGVDRGVRFRDLNADGVSDLIVNNERQNAIFLWRREAGWQRAPFELPALGWLVDAHGQDQGLRFVDLDGDADDDLVYSNDRGYSVRLFESFQTGWSEETRHGPTDQPDSLPPIVRGRQLGGVWFHGNAMIEENEFTTPLSREFIRRIPFEKLLGGSQ